ncbi:MULTISPECIES: hypothetical protein [Alicyclobacillus]|uniref:Uncharacterized protein n=1 Tax=Alicyclobacillus acidoterrestris (strain ATCC 49025 / DSM 3922 / CIP 106132 / NCIMB 13137 / GD3B) TaxID=1356854 RepID=T0BL18_ALIAG|nr:MULTISPECIES: hypothetical protein [Alicyclobacillus]EPZ44683.1 hypothetical protein N007_10625 [Alicyclobacillus acidoterrestris ATCC 49025]UNO50301.1 hypothetical protein K1I37_07455 [Alicyclobacillus acidoterrestris]GEO25532.1 hypothetical protein AAC03nite_13170 [Alicyclobacillus acidoterrestris]
MACPEVVTGSVVIPGEDYERIQRAVDNGQYLWRLSPVRTAQEVGTVHLGLRMNDVYTFVEQFRDPDDGLMHAVVRVKHRTCTFVVELFQPEKQGRGGIWVVLQVTPT